MVKKKRSSWSDTNEIVSYGKWLVKTLEDEHTCTKDSRRKMLKAPVICKLFLDDIRTDPDFRPKRIQEEITNPESTVVLDTVLDDVGSEIFHRFYVCFAVIRKLWSIWCRPIFGVDGCFMKCTLKGQILVAKLKSDFNLKEGQGFTIISDKQKGLLNAVERELPYVEHRMCARHIYGNLKKMFPHQDVHNNIFESFNNAIDPARYIPMVEMLETIRRKTMVRIDIRRIKAENHQGRLPPRTAEMLELEREKLKFCKVVPGFRSLLHAPGERTSHWGHVQPCLFCGEPVESRDHLYFACPYSFLVWLEVVGSLLHAPDPDWSATLGCLSTSSMDGNTYILLRLAFQATLYYLWREHNDRKHNQRYRSNTQLAATIEKAIKARIMSLRYYETPKLRNLLQVWFGSRRS
ncbi:unnamed protein product [Arabidopsis halleri]